LFAFAHYHILYLFSLISGFCQTFVCNISSVAMHSANSFCNVIFKSNKTITSRKSHDRKEAEKENVCV
jgi:hypothetical protein